MACEASGNDNHRQQDGERVVVANVEVTAWAARWRCVTCQALLQARIGGTHALRFARVGCGCGACYEVLSDTVVLIAQNSGTLAR